MNTSFAFIPSQLIDIRRFPRFSRFPRFPHSSLGNVHPLGFAPVLLNSLDRSYTSTGLAEAVYDNAAPGS